MILSPFDRYSYQKWRNQQKMIVYTIATNLTIHIGTIFEKVVFIKRKQSVLMLYRSNSQYQNRVHMQQIQALIVYRVSFCLRPMQTKNKSANISNEDYSSVSKPKRSKSTAQQTRQSWVDVFKRTHQWNRRTTGL